MKQPILLGTLGVAAAVTLGLGFTNPSDQEFLGFAFVTLRQELCPRLPEIIKDATQGQEIPQFLTTYLNQSCADILTAIRGPTEDFIRRNTQVQNYFLFSIYTTELFGNRYRTIGIARQFITMPVK